MMIKVYELRYSQQGQKPESGPALATLWKRPPITKIPSDCVCVATMMTLTEAESVCE